MIERIYVDNYRCLTSFEWQPNQVSLLLGDNGSGKTTIFNVLETLRDFLTLGVTTSEAFPPLTKTAWDARPEQTFELRIQGNGGKYTYHLIVEHEQQGEKNRIKSERLFFDQNMLYEFDGRDAHLHRDDGSAGPVFPFDWSRSAIPTVPARPDNQYLTWFRERVGRIYLFSPDPIGMTSYSEKEVPVGNRRLHDLASWLRYIMSASIETTTLLRDSLSDVINGLETFNYNRISETTGFVSFKFSTQNSSAESNKPEHYPLSLENLSEGQRCLIALFTILHTLVAPDTTVCIDEPDNFVALREIQPWLVELRDRVKDHDSQVLLISHSSEVANYLAADHGAVFYRESAGPTRVQKFDWKESDQVLAPAEILARGWE